MAGWVQGNYCPGPSVHDSCLCGLLHTDLSHRWAQKKTGELCVAHVGEKQKSYSCTIIISVIKIAPSPQEIFPTDLHMLGKK